MCDELESELVSRFNEYGLELSVPTTTPSTRKSTRVTPTLSEAVAANVTVPDKTALLAGEVKETVGSVVSAGGVTSWIAACRARPRSMRVQPIFPEPALVPVVSSG